MSKHRFFDVDALGRPGAELDSRQNPGGRSERSAPTDAERRSVGPSEDDIGEPAPALGELAPDDRRLLDAARAALHQSRVPEAARQRLFERALDEVRRPKPSEQLPAAQLVPVPARGAWTVLGSAAAMALGLVLLASVRPLFQRSLDDDALASGAPPRPEQRLGGRVFQSVLFRAPAPAWSGPLPSAGDDLFGESPFSIHSRTWQVKRWDDLSAPPAEPAKWFFEQGALCVTLRAGERVLGGWPWPATDERAAGAIGPATPSSERPAAEAAEAGAAGAGAAPARVEPVALSAGKAYQLVFKAWASEPVPAQLLVAVGHSRLPFSAAGGARVEVSPAPSPFVIRFVSKHDDPSVGVAFLANAAADAAPTRVCLSDMTLTER